MKRFTLAFAGFCAALSLGSPAAAVPLKKAPAALNPAKAYILVEYKLERNPFADFPGSRKTMPLKAGLTFARYDPALGDVRGSGRAKANPLPAGQPPRELFRNKPIAKGESSRLFLLEVDPGIWVVEGYANTAFALGSYSFDLAPGTVTDLGIVEAENDWAEGQRPQTGADKLLAAMAGPFADHSEMAPFRLAFRPRAAGDLPPPAGLPAASLRPVAFTADAKFGNYLGGLVNRIEGVNARLKAGAAPQQP